MPFTISGSKYRNLSSSAN